MKNVGSEIAVGFPESNEKAKERFVAQFVGSKRKKKLTGALIEMGFVNLPNSSRSPLTKFISLLQD